MNLELKVFSSLCSTEIFRINGIEADSDDFGEKYDHCPESAEDYCCGNMQFTPKPPTSEVLNKYHITEDEYYKIAEQLHELLSFGACCWCA